MTTNTISEPPAQADLDRRKAAAEATLAELQVEEKRRELLRSSGLLSRLNISVPMATVIVGLMTFFGSALGVYLQLGSQLAIKQREFESQLVLSALKDAGDGRSSLERLRFLIDSGYLSDPSGKIYGLILSGKYGDALALPSPPNVVRVLGSGDTKGILKEILKIAGPAVTSVHVVLEERQHFAAIAAVSRAADKFTLQFDKAAVESLDRDRRSNWRVAFVLSHEIGHIALGHLTSTAPRCLKPKSKDDQREPTTACVSIQKLELDADRFAGCTLRLLGSTLNEVELSFNFLSQEESRFHPPKSKRIEAAVAGWKSAGGQTCA